MPRFENTVVIGAHPDDELLWFTSVLRDAAMVIIVFKEYWADPVLGAKRAAAIADYPHDNVVFLEMAEAGTYGLADWANPVESETGLAFTSRTMLREAKRQARRTAAMFTTQAGPVATASVSELQKANALALKDRLRTLLRAQMNVFTHNPWGEYGHEDHVMVHRVVQDLAAEIGFTQWMSNYCTPRSLPLATRYFQSGPIDAIQLEADLDYARDVADLYKRHDCWTWDDDWEWFETEHVMPVPALPEFAKPFRRLFPLNMFTID
jgi:LmbE family N-acetylglucosaminyl deacetylase